MSLLALIFSFLLSSPSCARVNSLDLLQQKDLQSLRLRSLDIGLAKQFASSTSLFVVSPVAHSDPPLFSGPVK